MQADRLDTHKKLLETIIEHMIKEGVSEKFLSGFCQVTIQRAGMR